MARWGERAVIHQINRLYSVGSVAGLSESQLLERFLSRRDEAAFAALVARHGPMVMGVCRRLLGDSHDVEDAFQATFLVLVRKAGTLREHELLGHWLYAVAYRIAIRARANANRRRSKERPVIDLADAMPSEWDDVDDLKAVIDGEVRRLPEKYRAPVVLCYLEGRSNEEAARQLGCPVGTVRSRLARARDRLRVRLTRLGFAPSAALIDAALSAKDARAAVPRPLIESTVLDALAFGAGKTVALGIVPASVLILAEGALTTMFLTKLKLSAAGVLLLGSLAAGALAQAPAPGAGADSNLSSDERNRLKEVESKLDRLLKVLEGPRHAQHRGAALSLDFVKPDQNVTLDAVKPDANVTLDVVKADRNVTLEFTKPDPKATVTFTEPVVTTGRVIQHDIVGKPGDGPNSVQTVERVIVVQDNKPASTALAEPKPDRPKHITGTVILRKPSDSERLENIERSLGELQKKLDQIQNLLSRQAGGSQTEHSVEIQAK